MFIVFIYYSLVFICSDCNSSYNRFILQKEKKQYYAFYRTRLSYVCLNKLTDFYWKLLFCFIAILVVNLTIRTVVHVCTT